MAKTIEKFVVASSYITELSWHSDGPNRVSIYATTRRGYESYSITVGELGALCWSAYCRSSIGSAWLAMSWTRGTGKSIAAYSSVEIWSDDSDHRSRGAARVTLRDRSGFTADHFGDDVLRCLEKAAGGAS